LPVPIGHCGFCLEIHGLITDNNGLPLQGATVLLRARPLRYHRKEWIFRLSAGRNSALLRCDIHDRVRHDGKEVKKFRCLNFKLQLVQRQLDSVVVTAPGHRPASSDPWLCLSEVQRRGVYQGQGKHAVGSAQWKGGRLEGIPTNSGVGGSTKVTLVV